MSAEVVPFMPPSRKLGSWIAGYLEYTKDIWSTPRFRTWAAIMAVAGALERKVWIRLQGSNIYPNMFVFLIGGAGVGKTRPVEIAHSLWASLEDHHVAPVSVTKAALMDRLSRAQRVVHAPGFDEVFNSLLIASKELGALIPNYDSDFLNALTYLYDNNRYDEERRGIKEHLIIEHPCINIIGCTTPNFLLETMPAGAWEQGFLSRTMIIYDSLVSERILNLMDSESTQDTALRQALLDDMKIIGDFVGRLEFSKDANAIIQAWYADTSLAPKHPRLLNYNTRRPIHLLKLCMVATVDRGGNVITAEDARTAIGWLTDAEDAMPDVFTAMDSGGDAQVINECWHYTITMFARSGGQGVPVYKVFEFLRGRVPAYNVTKIFEVMVRSQMLRHDVSDGVGLVYPRAKI